MKLTKEQFAEFIREEALKIKQEMLKEEKEGYKVVGDPIKVALNKNDKAGDSDKALVYKDKKGEETKSGPNKVGGGYDEKAKDGMNINAKELGSDEKAAAAVKVDASGKKSGDAATKGMAGSKFTSKTDGPKISASEPYEEKFDGKMNSEDKEVDEGTKTYVEAGAEKGGNTVVSGQAKAKVMEKAPVVKDKEPIAKGIEIKGSNVKPSEVEKPATDATTPAAKALKESYTKKELISLIKEEAKRIIEDETKKIKLEKELETAKEELKKLSAEE